MALTDLTRISTSGIATGSTIDSPILRKDVSLRGSQVGVTSALFDSSDNALEFNDNVKIKLGNSGDLNLYHTGARSEIINNTGDLIIQPGINSNLFLRSQTGAPHFKGAHAAQVEIYYNGNEKIRTTNDGAVVTGILTASSYSGPISNPSGISTFYDLRVTNNLTVEGTTTTLDTNLIDVDRVEIGANSNTNTAIVGIQSGTADIVNLFDGTTEVLTVKDGGKVGIGLTNPTTKLQVASGHINLSAGYSIQWDNSHERIEQSDGKLEFFTANGEKMTLSGDNLGIGTDNPGQKLDVVGGNIRVGKTSNGQFIGENNSGIQKIKLDTDGVSFLNGGNVGIGTDNPTASPFAGAKLGVHLSDNTAYAGGTNRANGIVVYNTAAGGHSSLELAQRNAADTYGSVLLNAVDPPAGNNYGAEFTIQTRAAGGGSYGERVRINEHGLSIKNSTNTSALCVNNVRGTASAPSFNEANADGLLVDVYNTGNPYPRYVSLAARGYGTSTADMSFWTDSGTTVSERLRIKSDGTINITTANGSLEWTASSGSNPFIRSIGSGQQSLEFNTGGDERLRITSDGKLEVQGTRNGALQSNDDDALKLFTKSTSDDINRGTGITFYTHDGSGYEMGGTIQVAKENGTVDDPKSYMRFSTQDGSTTAERLRIHSHGQLELKVPDANDALKITPSGTNAHAKINFNTPGTGSAIFKVQGTERLRIDSNGRVIITNDGVTHSTGTNTQYAPLTVRGNTSATSSRSGWLTLARSEASANISANEGIGEIWFGDQQAGEYGIIKCFADADAAVGDYPGRLSFWTTADGASSSTERLRILSSGELRIISSGNNNDPAHLRLHCNDTSISINDSIGQIRFAGRDSGGSTVSRTGALIQATASNAWDTGQTSGYSATHLEFFTQNNSGIDTIAASPRLRINATGETTLCRINTFPNPNNTGSEILGSKLVFGAGIKFEERYPNGAYADRQDLVLRTNSGYGLGESDKIRFTAGGIVNIGVASPQYAKKVNIQGGDGYTLSVSNQDYTAHAAGSHSGIEGRIQCGGSVWSNATIKFVKHNGTSGDKKTRLELHSTNGYSTNAGLVVQPDGEVTKPLQPAFFVSNYGGNSISAAFPITNWNDAKLNNGSHFKTSGTNQGYFIVPVSGMYHFHANGFFNANDGTDVDVSAFINRINDSGSVQLVRSYDRRFVGDGAYGPSFAISCTVQLTKDDKVGFGASRPLHGNYGYFFGGYLVG